MSNDAIIKRLKTKISILVEFKKNKVLEEKEKLSIKRQINKERTKHFGYSNENISFDFSSINEKIDFSQTKWNEEVNFSGFILPKSCDFSCADFPLSVDFSLTNFLLYVDFSFTGFSSSADFRSVSFLSYTDFSSTNFYSSADFRSANFFSTACFRSAVFFSSSYFSAVIFVSYADFSSAVFKSTTYFRAAKVNFLFLYKASFEGDCSFLSTEFYKVPKVSCVSIVGVFDFNDIIWPKINTSKNPTDDELSYSQLKRLMNDSHLHHMEIFFFRKELLCRAEAAKRKVSKKLKFLDANWRTHKFIHIYDKISECGDSITRPLKGLLALFLTMSYFYPLIAGKFKLEHLSDGFNIKEGIYLSLRHTVLFLPSSKKNYDSRPLHKSLKGLFNVYCVCF